MTRRLPADAAYLLISLLAAIPLGSALGRNQKAPAAPSAIAVSHHHPASMAPRPAAPAPIKLPSSAERPAVTHLVSPSNGHGRIPSTMSHQPASALGGPAKYDARHGAVLGAAMGHRR
jgi:hypothetical protein